jgi:hypothetical protein
MAWSDPLYSAGIGVINASNSATWTPTNLPALSGTGRGLLYTN